MEGLDLDGVIPDDKRSKPLEEIKEIEENIKSDSKKDKAGEKKQPTSQLKYPSDSESSSDIDDIEGMQLNFYKECSKALVKK